MGFTMRTPIRWQLRPGNRLQMDAEVWGTLISQTHVIELSEGDTLLTIHVEADQNIYRVGPGRSMYRARTIPATQAPVPVIPTQPTTSIREGIWRLSGQEHGVRWDANLIIRNFHNNQFTGTLDWFFGTSERFVGREYFEGSFDESRQIVFMRGIRTAQGLELGQYQARVISDVRLTDGTWQGGTFTAVWVREE